jgi:nitroreductase
MAVADSNSNPFEQVDKLAKEIVRSRKKPLLILYYHENGGEIRDDNVTDIFNAFLQNGFSREKPINDLDVLLHTIGGSPHSGYMIAQAIRDAATNVSFLIPEYAYSAGTLLCMCGNKIRLADGAVISPIDVALTGSDENPNESVELMSVDYYIQFVVECRRQIEIMLRQTGSTSSTNVECPLLVEMVNQVRALNIGTFWRERTLTGYYAEILLMDYMFANYPNKENLKNTIIQKLVFEYPTHDFRMDYHICDKLKFPVEEMSVDEACRTKELVGVLRLLASQGLICKEVGATYKLPFIQFYGVETNDTNMPNKE